MELYTMKTYDYRFLTEERRPTINNYIPGKIKYVLLEDT